jgi:uncharacterized protein DUF6457
VTGDPAVFLERYRKALQEAAGSPVKLDGDDVEALLDLARDVAHGTERRNAPLATFLVGQFVAARAAEGATAPAALDEARALARTLLPDARL